jgi:hypothetical protein
MRVFERAIFTVRTESHDLSASRTIFWQDHDRIVAIRLMVAHIALPDSLDALGINLSQVGSTAESGQPA